MTLTFIALLVFSSYGQNLATSTNPGETSYAIFICIVGLVLFCLLIGNFQVMHVSFELFMFLAV